MSGENNILVVDAGNTSVKWTWFSHAGDVVALERDLVPSECNETPSAVYFSSVRDAFATTELYQALQDRFGDRVFPPLRSTTPMIGMRNQYQHPERLGVDRWLTAIAAHVYYPGNSMIVDVGTATKVDFVEQNGDFVGGYIAPGLPMMRSSLIAGTGQIRYGDHEMGKQVCVPNTTALAVEYGTREMLLGMVERLVLKHPDRQLILTGGGAKDVLDHLDLPFILDEHLLARGSLALGRSLRNQE